jgi:hypothetical protein
MRWLALLIVCAPPAACRHQTPVPSPGSACAPPQILTEDWTEVRVERGGFALRLPAGAAELPTRCFDSRCGRIQVGAWRLEYDRGGFAGPGDTLIVGPYAEEASLCTELIGGRRVFIQTYRISAASRDHSAEVRGKLFGRATTAVSPGNGLYLYVLTESPEALREFLAAVRTLRVF